MHAIGVMLFTVFGVVLVCAFLYEVYDFIRYAIEQIRQTDWTVIMKKEMRGLGRAIQGIAIVTFGGCLGYIAQLLLTR